MHSTGWYYKVLCTPAQWRKCSPGRIFVQRSIYKVASLVAVEKVNITTNYEQVDLPQHLHGYKLSRG